MMYIIGVTIKKNEVPRGVKYDLHL